MDDPSELTAKYICGIGEESVNEVVGLDYNRLRVALHVFQAMPNVRKYVIKDIFEAVGNQVNKDIDGVEFGESELQGVWFWTKETGDFAVFSEAWQGGKGAIWLTAGIYSYEDSIKDETRERFVANVDLETWSAGKVLGNHYVGAYVNQKHGGGGWHSMEFLSRAILDRDGVVQSVAKLLGQIYRSCFPIAPN